MYKKRNRGEVKTLVSTSCAERTPSINQATAPIKEESHMKEYENYWVFGEDDEISFTDLNYEEHTLRAGDIEEVRLYLCPGDINYTQKQMEELERVHAEVLLEKFPNPSVSTRVCWRGEGCEPNGDLQLIVDGLRYSPVGGSCDRLDAIIDSTWGEACKEVKRRFPESEFPDVVAFTGPDGEEYGVRLAHVGNVRIQLCTGDIDDLTQRQREELQRVYTNIFRDKFSTSVEIFYAPTKGVYFYAEELHWFPVDSCSLDRMEDFADSTLEAAKEEVRRRFPESEYPDEVLGQQTSGQAALHKAAMA